MANAVVGERGRAVPTERLHLTLAFLGHLQPPAVEQALTVADNIKAEAFEFHLDRLGYFYRPRILWLGAKAPPSVLMALAQDVRSGLVAAGLQLERRRFAPHVTLARRAPPPDKNLTIEPVLWPVQSFCLVESINRGSDLGYEVIRTWPLKSAA